MKPIKLIALLGAFSSIAAHGAYTDPVGYTTATISAAFDASTPKNNVIAPDLQIVADWAGTISSISGDALTLSGTLTDGKYDATDLAPGSVQYAYYVQTADGYWAHVVSNDTTSVTVESGFGANFAPAESVSIHRHITINDYFGPNNETGLKDDSVTFSTLVADNIILIDEVNGGTITVFANNSLGGTWTTSAFAEAGGIPIYPNQALQVLRRGTTDLPVVFAGGVEITGRQFTVTTGAQVRPFTWPVAVKLDDLNLYTGNPATGVAGTATGTLSEADVVNVIVDGAINSYVYVEIDFGLGIGWYTTDFTARAPDLPAGAGLIINRTNSVNNSPFVWDIPAVVVAP